MYLKEMRNANVSDHFPNIFDDYWRLPTIQLRVCSQLLTNTDSLIAFFYSDRKSRKKKKKKTKTRPGQDPGSDPDLVSSGQLPDQALKAVGVQPGTKHEGSVQALLEGKEDIELAGVELTKEQVNIANRITFLFLFFLSPQARRLYER